MCQSIKYRNSQTPLQCIKLFDNIFLRWTFVEHNLVYSTSTNSAHFNMTEYTSLSSNEDIEFLDTEEMCSSPESTPSQVRRRISDVKLNKEKYVDRAKNTISAGRLTWKCFVNTHSLPLYNNLLDLDICSLKIIWILFLNCSISFLAINLNNSRRRSTIFWTRLKNLYGFEYYCLYILYDSMVSYADGLSCWYFRLLSKVHLKTS